MKCDCGKWMGLVPWTDLSPELRDWVEKISQTLPKAVTSVRRCAACKELHVHVKV